MSCNASITISDGLNPLLTQNIINNEQSVLNVVNISFIGKEVRASKLVLNEIKKIIVIERKIKRSKNSDVAAYFFDSPVGEFDEDKFKNTVKCSMLKLDFKEGGDQYEESSSIKGYLRKDLIIQVVLPEILKYQISLYSEISTKNVFDAIKNFWILLVKPTSDLLQYELNKTELQKRLRAQGIKSYSSIIAKKDDSKLILGETYYINKAEDTVEDNDQLIGFDKELSILLRENTSQEMQNLAPNELSNESRPQRPPINFDLLERLLVSTVFRQHNLDIDPYDIKVIINQKPSGNRLWLKTKGLFKRDLASIGFSGKGEAVYGIKYDIKKGVLRLYGAPEEELGGETVIVQVTTKRGWILRELWLHCLPSTLKVENKNIYKE